MTADQRSALMQKGLAELMKRRAGYVLFVDAKNGDNYAEVSSDFRAEVSHRRWPACKLPPLAPSQLTRLDRLGFRDSERNPMQSYEGWSLARMTKNLESVFLEVYGCPADFELTVQSGE
jgi:hypothetical protein